MIIATQCVALFAYAVLQVICVTVLDEAEIAPVRLLNRERVFNRTPILFRSCCDFRDIRHDSIRVPAIGAIEFLNCVKVRKAVPVDDHIFRTPH